MVSILLTTFQMHFVDWKPFYFVLYFTEIFSYDSNLQQATNGLFNVWRQAVIVLCTHVPNRTDNENQDPPTTMPSI